MKPEFRGQNNYIDILRNLGVQPSKSLGQNFLHSEMLAEWQVQVADVKGKNVLEVGPGTGILTKHLATRAKHVWAIEADLALFNYLKKELEKFDNLSLIHGDILKQAFPVETNRIVSNLPYSISLPFFQKIAQTPIEKITLMVQKEFAEKISAPVGSKNYRFISFLTQFVYDITILKKVPRNYFYPRPKVDSMIIQLTVRNDLPSFWGEIRPRHFSYLKKIFERKNKKLKNTLKSLPSSLSSALGTTLEKEILDLRSREINRETGREILLKIIEIEKEST